MRLKAGRPDLRQYAGNFAVAPAAPDAPLNVTWLGVATLLLDDGESAIMTDGFFSRPGLARVAAGRLASSHPRVDGCLARAGVHRLDAVVCVHSHYDHAMDAALVSDRTGAVLVGGESTANIGLGYDLPREQIRVMSSEETVRFGAFDITLVASHHCPPDRYPGVITEPVRAPVRTSAYKCGESWSVLVFHNPTGRR
ncbi:MAG TPA: MBL fold metallo-hydrolase, partial [Mycobacterium sp.]|nr:MBL fold metallo-hydrolase [Mycobacterium sp.]